MNTSCFFLLPPPLGEGWGGGSMKHPLSTNAKQPMLKPQPFFEPLTTVPRDAPTPALPQRGRESIP